MCLDVRVPPYDRRISRRANIHLVMRLACLDVRDPPPTRRISRRANAYLPQLGGQGVVVCVQQGAVVEALEKGRLRGGKELGKSYIGAV